MGVTYVYDFLALFDRVRAELAAMALCALAGCVVLPIPHDRLVTPLISGTVIDARSKQPVANARVVASEGHSFQVRSRALADTKTDSQGLFTLAAYERGEWYVFDMYKNSVCIGTFTIEHERYKTAVFEERYPGYLGAFDGPCSSIPIERTIELEPKE